MQFLKVLYIPLDSWMLLYVFVIWIRFAAWRAAGVPQGVCSANTTFPANMLIFVQVLA